MSMLSKIEYYWIKYKTLRWSISIILSEISVGSLILNPRNNIYMLFWGIAIVLYPPYEMFKKSIHYEN